MTSKESMEAYRKALKEYKEHNWQDDSEEYEQKLNDAIKAIVPEVGMPCTVCYWSDYRAAAIVRVEDSQ